MQITYLPLHTRYLYGFKDSFEDGMEEGIIKGFKQKVETVSYTHLDVYKRQLLHQCHNLFHTVLFISIGNQLPVFKADRKILFFPFFIFSIILIRFTQAQKVSVCLLYTSRCV